jgi:hypothetical protein
LWPLTFLYSCCSRCHSLLLLSLIVCLPMVRVKHTMCPVGDEALPEATDATSQELTEVLSS